MNIYIRYIFDILVRIDKKDLNNLDCRIEEKSYIGRTYDIIKI